MSFIRTLALPLGASLVALSPLSAQIVPEDYSHNWAPMHAAPTAAFTGPALFGGTGTVNFADAGDSIRRCYGIDSTQGGRNQSAGRFENSWFKTVQSYAPNQALQSVDIGLVSISSATESDLAGDACFAPFFSSAGNTGDYRLTVAAVLGQQSGTAPGFPTFWENAFRWTATGSSFYGLGGPSTLGTAADGNPLLVNVIYEIQGPLTGGAANNQYYLASTTELTGIQPAAPGGVANGNPLLASAIFGANAVTSNAVSHTRLTSTDPAVGTFFTTNIFINRPGDTEICGYIAFNTPVLWAVNNGNDGAGGTDWRVSSSPISNVDLRVLDQRSGGETNANINYKSGAAAGPDAVAFNPAIVFNQSFFLWSASTVLNMQQKPTSWDDLGGVLPFAVPGSFVLGSLATSREGLQTVPIVFDGLTSALLSVPGLSLGTKFTGSEDPFLDGVPGTGGANSSLWEGMFTPIISGVSTLTGAGPGGFPAVATPQPALSGATLGIANIGLQVVIGAGGAALVIPEVSSSLEVNLQ